MQFKNLKLFDKGKRGLIYTGTYKNKKIAVKVKKPESEAENRIYNEGKFLEVLNKENIGPKLIYYDDEKLVYEFVEGDFILDFVKKKGKREIIKVILNILDQCFVMDKLGINKLEMHHPIKHIIVGKKPVMIDFERAYYTKKPKNLTQFLQFLSNYKKEFLKKDIKINLNIEMIKKYKREINLKNYETIKKNLF